MCTRIVSTSTARIRATASAKFSIVAPTELSRAAAGQRSHGRRWACSPSTLTGTRRRSPSAWNSTWKSNDDLILSVSAESSRRSDQAGASYFDLEFGIGLPGSDDLGPADVTDDPSQRGQPAAWSCAPTLPTGRTRSSYPGTCSKNTSEALCARLPGPIEATEEQLIEHLYYQTMFSLWACVGRPRV